MTAKLITTPGGEKLAILPAGEYEDLCDALAHANAMAEYRAGHGRAVRRHRRFGSRHEVIGVDDNWRVPPASRTAARSLNSLSSPIELMFMSGNST